MHAAHLLIAAVIAGGILPGADTGANQGNMTSLLPRIDHLVYATPNLAAAVEHLEHCSEYARRQADNIRAVVRAISFCRSDRRRISRSSGPTPNSLRRLPRAHSESTGFVRHGS